MEKQETSQSQEQSQEREFTLQGTPVVLTVDLEQKDFAYCLELGEKAKGKGKRYFQMILAAVLAVGFLISFVMDTSYLMGLFLGLFSALLLVLILILPAKLREKSAQMMAEQLSRMEISFYSNGVRVHDGMFPMDIQLEKMAVYSDPEYLVVETTGDRIYPIPLHSVREEEKQPLEKVISEYPGYYRFESGLKK